MSGSVERPRYFGDHFPGVDKQFKQVLSLHMPGDLDAREGVGTNGVLFGELTVQNVDGALLFDTNAAADAQYTDDTGDVNTGTYTFVITAANDALYIGMNNKFSGLLVDMGTAGIGSTVVWSYWNGASWVNLATAHNLLDDSTSLTAGTSTYNVTWKMPSDWVKRDVGDAQAEIENMYWVRLNAAGNYTTDPIITALDVYEIVGRGVRIPFNGYLDRVGYTFDVEGNDVDLVLNLINITSGESTTVTLPDQERVGSVAVDATWGLYFKQGDELVVQAVTSSTTEHADANLVFEFRV
jgi:hypothetical protein